MNIPNARAIQIADSIRTEFSRICAPDYPFKTSYSAEYRGRILKSLYQLILNRADLVKATPGAAKIIKINGLKGLAKLGVTREHIVPNNVMMDVVMQSTSADHLISLCRSCWRHGEVIAMLKSEEKQLQGGPKKTSLAHNMPAGWQPTDDPIIRYDQAGIDPLVELTPTD